MILNLLFIYHLHTPNSKAIYVVYWSPRRSHSMKELCILVPFLKPLYSRFMVPIISSISMILSNSFGHPSGQTFQNPPTPPPLPSYPTVEYHPNMLSFWSQYPQISPYSRSSNDLYGPSTATWKSDPGSLHIKVLPPTLHHVYKPGMQQPHVLNL